MLEKNCLLFGTAKYDRAIEYIDIFTNVLGHIPNVTHHDIMNHPSGPYYSIFDDVTKDQEKDIRNKVYLLDLPTTVRD